ncbi:phytoene/squalene synthase family protein [Cohaesibacter celericrescens]|uniref:phytoene/squalene synthase family protein n=1 Tax=Cohaesibacter celericrescens TaxID=2067669 RepID=UPI00356AB6F3
MSTVQDNLVFCKTELRKLDPVAHFSSLTADKKHRAALISFLAFVAEISRIPKMVSDPSMGEVRLQWWRDIVGDRDNNKTFSAKNIGPLAAALKDTQRRYNLPAETLLQIIDAHTFDLYNDPMPDVATYEAYAGETAALPILLSAQILNGGEHPNHLSDLCGHAGMAIALANNLFDWPKAANAQRLFLPATIFVKEGVGTHDIFNQKSSQNLIEAIRSCTQLGHDHHSKAMAFYQALQGEGRSHLAPAFLMLAPAKRLLIKRSKDPINNMTLANWRAYLSIWRMAALS